MNRRMSWQCHTHPQRRRVVALRNSFGWMVDPISITFGFRHVAKTPPTTLLTHRHSGGKYLRKNAPFGASEDATTDY